MDTRPLTSSGGDLISIEAASVYSAFASRDLSRQHNLSASSWRRAFVMPFCQAIPKLLILFLAELSRCKLIVDYIFAGTISCWLP